MSKSNIKLTTKQRYWIAFLSEENKLVPQQIRKHPQLAKPNGSVYQLKVIQHWLNRWKETGEVNELKKSGRPRLLDKKEEEHLVKFIKLHPKLRYRKIKYKLNLPMHRMTVNRYSLRNGFRTCVAVQKPLLKQHHINERKAFVSAALKHPRISRIMILTDEKRFQGAPSGNRVLVNRRKGERFEDRHVIRHQSGGPSANIWYSIGPLGKGKLFLAENKDLYDPFGNLIDQKASYKGFDSDSYVYMLEHHALPAIQKVYKNFVFIQDNASIHRARTADKKALKCDVVFDKLKVKTIKFPPKSPDLNCIEHCHVLLQRKLDDFLTKFEKLPKNKKQLFRILKLCWERVSNKSVMNIYSSFLNRCFKVHKAKGRNNLKL